MKIKGRLMDAEDVRNTFRRMAHQIVEQDGAEDLVLIGIRTRGVTVAKRLKACIDAVEGTDLPLGVFDITLYRDDLEDLASEVCFAGSEVDTLDRVLTVVLCDDVIYTGRTVRAALSEVMALGRPARIRFAALGRPRPPRAPLQARLHGQERADLPPGGDRRPLHGGRRGGRRAHLRQRIARLF